MPRSPGRKAKPKALSKLTVGAIRTELAGLGLSTKGVRDTLYKRLKQALAAGATRQKPATASATPASCERPLLPGKEGGTSNNQRKKQLMAMWAKYSSMGDVEPESNMPCVGVNGLLELCSDLSVDPVSDVALLVLAWKLRAKRLCVFSRREFLELAPRLDCCTVADLKAALPRLRDELRDRSSLRAIYDYAWGYYTEDPASRSMELETACSVWEMVFVHVPFDVAAWNAFLKDKYKRKVPRDTYKMLLLFVLQFDGNWSTFDETAAWPVVLDEFYDHVTGRDE